ncbi:MULTISPECIES: DUF4870 domain-containing protein [unclassified Leucobacter]|uniref:DUF4870 domain-containing protein n=1 Tax=unclassified Leucobacter TaxID=2621730 RepID=UPI00165E1B5B|nr:MULTISPECIES: DUF4870 domain-containing protein [unclassified Leucobacter]MBC9935257.1 DUF4870 domain-containing protein [Leucobacter sp. cx-87]
MSDPVFQPAPQQPLTPQPAYPLQQQYVQQPPTGRKSWALGFLAYIPAPLVGIVIAGIVMAAVYPSTKRRGIPLATENARIAANWGLTVLSVVVLLGLYVLTLAVGFPETKSAGFFPIGFAVLGYVVLAIAHAVVTIAGTVISGTRVFRNPLAIPFLRPSA